MSSVTGVPGGGVPMSRIALDAQYDMAAARKQVEAMRDQGEASVKLIQSAAIDADVGQRLNVMA